MGINALKRPPHSIEAEQGVLGSILLDPAVLDGLTLAESDFYDRRHQVLFEAMREMSGRNVPFDALTFGEFLKDGGLIDKVGGYDHLIELQDDTIVPGHATHYADIVLEKANLRKIIERAGEAVEDAYKGEDKEVILSNLQSISITGVKKKTRMEQGEEAKKLAHDIATGKRKTIPLPFTGLDEITLGLERGITCPLTGRGGKGKSMLKAYWEAQLGMNKTPVLDLCFEDNVNKMIHRVASSLGEFDLFRLKRGSVNQQYMDTLNRCIDKVIDDLPIEFDDESCTVEVIEGRVNGFVSRHEELIRKNGGVVFVDGLKDVILSKGDNQTAQEGHISQTFARIAVKHKDITIIPVSHLTDLEPSAWIAERNIRGNKLQGANARAVMILQDAGFSTEQLAKAGGDTEGLCCLEVCKNNYGNEGRILLRKCFEKGRFNVISDNYG